MLPPCHILLEWSGGSCMFMFLRFLGRIQVLWKLGDGIKGKAKIGPLKGGEFFVISLMLGVVLWKFHKIPM